MEQQVTPARPGPMPALPPRRRKPPTAAKAFTGRFMLGHLIAYPVGFLTAVASMPLGMVVRKRQLMAPGQLGAKTGIIQDVAKDMALSPLEAAQVELVLGFSLWACLAALLLIHLAVLPWAFAAARAVRQPESGEARVRRAYRMFTWVTAATLALVGLAGIGSWIWVLTL